MAKFHLNQLNNWVTPLIMVSIGLHGLVLALPMPDLAKPPESEPELTESDVIQVVSLPKLAKGDEPTEPQLPKPEEEPPPLEEPGEVLLEERVLSDLDVLDEVEPEPEKEQEPEEPKEEAGTTNPIDEPPANPSETELDKKLKNRENYTGFNDALMGEEYQEGGSQFKGNMTAWVLGKSLDFEQFPIHLEAIEAYLPSVPALACLDDAPGDSVSVVVQVSLVDGTLVGEPETLNSAGYMILNQKALEIAKKIDYSPYYNPDDPAAGYWFNVPVNYDPC
ncbi:MAG: hypothetical protein AAF572_17110 [Cyanobacteria bacterium P01_B01_bin.77]